MSEVSKINQTETAVQLAKSRHFEVVSVSTPEQMKYALSVSELSKLDQIKTKIKITEIAFKYLSISSKVKNISDLFIEILVEHIVNSCSNLALSEIDYIFKNGILGKLGNNYQEISIDTITGETGWIENYYSKERAKRPEPELPKIEVSKTAMTYQEWIEKNPDQKNNLRKYDLMMLIKNGSISMDIVKEYFNDDDFVNSKISEFKSYIPKLISEHTKLSDQYNSEKNLLKRRELKIKLDAIERYFLKYDGKEKTEDETILYFFELLILNKTIKFHKCPIQPNQ